MIETFADTVTDTINLTDTLLFKSHFKVYSRGGNEKTRPKKENTSRRAREGNPELPRRNITWKVIRIIIKYAIFELCLLARALTLRKMFEQF